MRKQVRFHEQPLEHDHARVSDALAVRFRPVMTEHCSVGNLPEEPPINDFPIVNPTAFILHWLRLDYRDGGWQGEFGYQATAKT